jgi:flagellar hook-length control protein FliK
VVSVTSEASSNLSFQGTTQRSTRTDSAQSQNNDSFSALVDSNTSASNGDNRPQDTSAPAPAPRRADDQAPATDSAPRDNTAAADKTAQNNADDQNAAAGAPANTNADANAAANADASGRAKAKSASNSDDTKSTLKSKSSAETSSAKDQPQAKQDGAIAAAVATAIPVAAAPTAAPAATTSTPDKPTAPLAIAAAAIAATAAITEAAPAATSSVVTGTDASASTAATASAAKPADSKIDLHAAFAEALQGTAGDATATNGVAASVATGAPAPAKAAAPAKGPVIAKEGITISGDPNAATGTTGAPATAAPTSVVPGVTQPTAVAGKQKPEGGLVDAVKTDASGNSTQTLVANAATNGASAAADAGQNSVNVSDNSLQAAGALQPQLQSATAAPVAASQLTVTAATNGAVPLSGVAMEIAASAKSGKSRFEIRLDPADLGRIDVRIDVDRNGQVTSHLTVDKPETLSMLRQDAPQLQRALDDAGFKTGGSGLQFSLRDQSSSGQNSGNDNGRNAQRLVINDEDTTRAAVTGRTYGRMLGSSSGVDIRV